MGLNDCLQLIVKTVQKQLIEDSNNNEQSENDNNAKESEDGEEEKDVKSATYKVRPQSEIQAKITLWTFWIAR